jgi:hypothetical protein
MQLPEATALAVTVFARIAACKVVFPTCPGAPRWTTSTDEDVDERGSLRWSSGRADHGGHANDPAAAAADDAARPNNDKQRKHLCRTYSSASGSVCALQQTRKTVMVDSKEPASSRDGGGGGGGGRSGSGTTYLATCFSSTQQGRTQPP